MTQSKLSTSDNSLSPVAFLVRFLLNFNGSNKEIFYMPAPVLMLNKDELTLFFRSGEMSSSTYTSLGHLEQGYMKPCPRSHLTMPFNLDVKNHCSS